MSAPVQLPLGRHVVSVGAEDRHGALGLGRVAIEVVSDGTVPLEPGTELLEVAVPRGTSASSFALVGEESIALLPDARVVAGPSGAPVASLGDLALGVGAGIGEAWAVGDATLANRSHVRGALHLGGDLSASASAVLDGVVVRDGPYTPFETARFVIPSAGIGDDLRLRPGETASLAAGAHGAVDLAPRSRLVLAHGAHSMSSLAVASGAEVVVEGDAANPTIVRVEGSFRWQGSVSSSTGPALAVVAMSSADVQLHSTFDGWIIAPRAEVTLLPRCSTYRGAVIARAVRVQPNVVVEHTPLAFALPDDVLSACALTPLVTCVRDNSDGSQTAVFGYTSLLRHMAAVVPRGATNHLYPPVTPSTDHQSFDPIGEERAFEVTFDDEVRWILGTRSAVANRESPRCL